MATAGDSGVVVLVPAAEAVIGASRRRYDRASAQGMPAHITLLYPFLPEPLLRADVLGRLRTLCAATAPFDLELRRTARFPETIYLEPEPPAPFRRLTAAIVEEWPDARPYGGQFDEVTPHLTIADGVDTEVMDVVDRDVSPRLPLRTRLTEAHLFVFDGTRWQPREPLPFAG